MYESVNKPRATRVLIGSPSTGTEEAAFKQSIFRLVGACDPEFLYVTPQDCEGSNIASNQNKLARMAVDQGYDYLLLVETDIAFPNHALHQLLSWNKPIAGCSTPWKERDILAARLNGETRPMRYMGHELDETEITMASLIEGEALRRVNFLPMGLMLLSCDAIRRVSEHRRQHSLPPDVRDRAQGKFVPVFTHFECYPADADEGVISTSDAAFCADARAAGLDIWLDARLSLWVEHIGKTNFVAPASFRNRAEEEATRRRLSAAPGAAP